MTFLFLVPNLSFFTHDFKKDFEFDVKLGVGVKICNLMGLMDGWDGIGWGSKVSFNVHTL